jgi:hypothetical protein
MIVIGLSVYGQYTVTFGTPKPARRHRQSKAGSRKRTRTSTLSKTEHCKEPTKKTHDMVAAAARSWIHMVIFAATLAVTLYVVTDMEFPRHGLVRIDNLITFW